MGVTLSVVGALLVCLAGDAIAENDREFPQTHEAPADLRWYGLPIVVSDVASDVALFLVPPAGLAGVALGAPIVHWSHGHVAKGFGSLGLRAGAEVLTVIMFASALSCDSCSRSRLLPSLVPLAVVEVIDAAALSWEHVPGPTHSLAAPWFRVEPTIAMLRSGGSVGLVGTF